MSDDVEREDRILGAALSRAIETQPTRETPFETSRLALRMASPSRSFLVPALVGAIGVVVGLTLAGAVLSDRGEEPAPAATQPGTVPSPVSQTAVPASERPDRDAIRVYFARDQLPPLGATIRGIFNAATPDSRILSRINELHRLRDALPAGAMNPISLLGVRQGSSSTFGLSVRVDGDLATVEFEQGTFGQVRGTASQAVVQQLVYVVTEEPAVRRVAIRERGNQTAIIGGLVIDRPLSREDVFGYLAAMPSERIVSDGETVRSALDSSVATDSIAFGLGRLTVRLTPTAGDPRMFIPNFTAEILRNTPPDTCPTPCSMSSGKWVIRLFVPGGADPRAGASSTVEPIDLSPLKDIRIASEQGGTAYYIGVEDARPWRVSVRPQPATQIFVDIGGPPAAISQSVAVYSPRSGEETSRNIALFGAARAFEANVEWRVRGPDERVVASGHVTATVGTSAVWGRFTTNATVPQGFSGDAVVEVYWSSTQDGRPMGLVEIPFRIR